MTTEWIPWTGGECPIPDAKAGEYEFRRRGGFLTQFDHSLDAKSLNWEHISDLDLYSIVAYRLIEKEQSDLDWLEGEISKMITREKFFPTPIQKAWAKGSNHGLECALERIRERRKIKS